MLSASRRRPQTRGFSSMEVLAGLGLTLILLAAVYSFQQDLNGDNAIGAPGEDVTYDLSNGTIRRTDGLAEPVVLASGVPTGGLSFLYFDNGKPPGQIGPGAVLNQCQRDSVGKVRVTVRANLPNPNSRIPTPIASVAESEVAIRNRSLDQNF